MSDVIVVERLTVEVITGAASDDPYGQGFSAIVASGCSSERTVVESLTRANQEKRSVTLRCAMLDVTGPITKIERHAETTRVKLYVEDLSYRRPTSLVGRGLRRGGWL